MWIWLGGIVVLLILVVTLIVMSNITITLMIKEKNWDETILLDVTFLYGLLSIHYQVPTIVLNNFKEGFKVENNAISNLIKRSNTSSGEQHINKEKLDFWKTKYTEIVRAIFQFKKWLNGTLKRVSLTKLDWSTNIALDDAAHTATITGLLWGLKTTMIGALSNHLIMKQKPNLFVVPVFGGRPSFSTQIHCIAKIRCGYAIYAGLILVVRVLKVKGGIKKWLNILFKG